MDTLSKVVEVAVPMRDNGSVIVPSNLVVDLVSVDDTDTIVGVVSDFSSGESNTIAGNNQIARASAAIKALLLKHGKTSYVWYNSVRLGFLPVYCEQNIVEVETANKAWARLLEKANFEIPKADNKKAVEEAKRKEAIKKRMESVADLDGALATAFAKKDETELALLLKEEKRRNADKNKGKIEALKPLKDEIREALKLCNNEKSLKSALNVLLGK